MHCDIIARLRFNPCKMDFKIIETGKIMLLRNKLGNKPVINVDLFQISSETTQRYICDVQLVFFLGFQKIATCFMLRVNSQLLNLKCDMMNYRLKVRH